MAGSKGFISKKMEVVDGVYIPVANKHEAGDGDHTIKSKLEIEYEEEIVAAQAHTLSGPSSPFISNAKSERS